VSVEITVDGDLVDATTVEVTVPVTGGGSVHWRFTDGVVTRTLRDVDGAVLGSERQEWDEAADDLWAA
jgi:hypothetical protein